MASAGFEAACGEIRGACGDPRRLGLLLAPRSPAERQQIRAAYRATFGEDLAATIQGTLVPAGEDDEVRKKKRRAFSAVHGGQVLTFELS